MAIVKFDPYLTDSLMRDLVGHDRRPVAFLVYLWLAAEQQRRQPVTASYSSLAESIGVSKSSVQAAIGWLARRELISVRRSYATATPSYTVHTPWRSDPRRMRSRAS